MHSVCVLYPTQDDPQDPERSGQIIKNDPEDPQTPGKFSECVLYPIQDNLKNPENLGQDMQDDHLPSLIVGRGVNYQFFDFQGQNFKL